MKDKKEAHESDYFYKKGLKFKDAKEKHHKDMFNEQYPFTSRSNASITPSKKKELHDKLYKESRRKTKNRIRTELEEKQKKWTHKNKDDKVKE